MDNKSKVYGELYKKLAIERKKKNKFYSEGRLFASASGVNCERQLRYGFEGIEKKSDFIWWGHEDKIGNAIHKEIQDNFKAKFGNDVQIEKYEHIIIEGLKINPKIDMIFKNKIWELKTVNEDEGQEIRSKDEKQAQFYMGVTGLKKAVISYFSRSKGIHINSFEIDFDQDMFDKIKEKFVRVIKGKQLKSDTRECKYCEYSWTCPDYKKSF